MKALEYAADLKISVSDLKDNLRSKGYQLLDDNAVKVSSSMWHLDIPL